MPDRGGVRCYFEIHERDGKGEVVIRPTTPAGCLELERVSADDSGIAGLRGYVRPGDYVTVIARVRHVRTGGGYLEEDPDPGETAIRYTLELVPDMSESWIVARTATKDGELPGARAFHRGRWIEPELGAVLVKVRAVLDMSTCACCSAAVDLLHEAEEILSPLLGNPVWSRPDDTSR